MKKDLRGRIDIMTKRLLALFLIAIMLTPAIMPKQDTTPVYVVGDISSYAFRDFVSSYNISTVDLIKDVPDDALSVIISPMDRNSTTFDEAKALASEGMLVIVLYDDNYTYDKRLDYFDVKEPTFVDDAVNITKLPLSARSIDVPYVIASGAMFNATYVHHEVLIPGRYNGTQCNDTAFALYKPEGSGRIILMSDEILNYTSNEPLFKAIYRTLYRVSYPYVTEVNIPSLSVAPPGPTFFVKVVNASTFDLDPYYKEDNDISVNIYIYRYSNGSQVTTLVPTYDSYKEAYFFPATDFGGKRGVFIYNVTVKFNNGTLIYQSEGLIQVASDEGYVVGYINVSKSYIETLRKLNYVAYKINDTKELSQYLADALIVGEEINDTEQEMIYSRYSEGNSFIAVAGNRTSDLGVNIGPERTYAVVNATERLGNVTINLNSSRYIEVNNLYHVPLVVGDDKELVSMIENPNGGKALVVADRRLIDPNTNLDLLTALIEKASVHHRLNVTYYTTYENDTYLFFFVVKDEEGNPVNVTFIYAENATVEEVKPGLYRVYPLQESFKITFYEPGYGYKTIVIGAYENPPENPGTAPETGGRSFEETSKSIGTRTFVAFLIIVALIAGVIYTLKRK